MMRLKAEKVQWPKKKEFTTTSRVNFGKWM